MLFIGSCESSDNLRTLSHGDLVFHEALGYVQKGETSFHVLNPNGGDYCLQYRRNEEIQHASPNFPNAPLFLNNLLFPDYICYDENDTDMICLGIFEEYSGVYFQDVNEYAVVLVRLLLKRTEMEIYVGDSRIQWFLDAESMKRIHIVTRPGEVTEGRVMIVRNDFVFDTLVGKYDAIDPVCLFHNVFLLQYIRSLSDHRIRRLTVNIPDTEGIGSILNNFFRIKNVADRYGVEVSLKSNCTRYPDELLQKYFKIPIARPDPDTVELASLFTVAFSYITCSQRYVLNKAILNDTFLGSLEKYQRAIFAGKRMLGVLVRGSDYIATNMPVQPLPIDELIPLIEKIRKEGAFDHIFLATEDLDYYEALTARFKGVIYAVSQERISARDLKELSFLSNMEKEKSKEEDNANIAEDNLSNYFYAIYLLSECQGFLGMPAECNGVKMVLEFNGNRFEFVKVVTRNI